MLFAGKILHRTQPTSIQICEIKEYAEQSEVEYSRIQICEIEDLNKENKEKTKEIIQEGQ